MGCQPSLRNICLRSVIIYCDIRLLTVGFSSVITEHRGQCELNQVHRTCHTFHVYSNRLRRSDGMNRCKMDQYNLAEHYVYSIPDSRGYIAI